MDAYENYDRHEFKQEIDYKTTNKKFIFISAPTLQILEDEINKAINCGFKIVINLDYVGKNYIIGMQKVATGVISSRLT